MRRNRLALATAAAALLLSAQAADAAAPQQMVGVNVVLQGGITPSSLADLGRYGTVLTTNPAINAVTMRVRLGALRAMQALPNVVAANEDQRRVGIPLPENPVTDTSLPPSTVPWNLDQIGVADGTTGRAVSEKGDGVYVAVLDTGLLSTWRYYFNEDRIASEYAVALSGGGGQTGAVSKLPNKWQTDQNSHGTHVTSTIIGYRYGTGETARQVQGVAPLAKIIPVKVLNQSGSGWSSVIAAGITYVADLKAEGGPLHDSPVVINMSLGGPTLDAMESAAIDYAIGKGVIVVASAGNEGDDGMGYPGAYAPVISVAASGFTGEWTATSWWRTVDVPSDPAGTAYITDFSSRAKSGQDLDVAAPGSWVLGPYQTSGQVAWWYLGGTSMASPHVAGVVALMLDHNAGLTATQTENILECTAVHLDAGSATVLDSDGSTELTMSWGTDATGSGIVDAPAAITGTCP